MKDTMPTNLARSRSRYMSKIHGSTLGLHDVSLFLSQSFDHWVMLTKTSLEQLPHSNTGEIHRIQLLSIFEIIGPICFALKTILKHWEQMREHIRTLIAHPVLRICLKINSFLYFSMKDLNIWDCRTLRQRLRQTPRNRQFNGWFLLMAIFWWDTNGRGGFPDVWG